MLNKNQLPADFGSPVISSLELCQKNRNKKPERNYKTRDRWYNNYATSDQYLQRSSQVPGQFLKHPVEKVVDEKSYKAGDFISSIEAMSHSPGENGLDIRPKVFDNMTKAWFC